MDFEDYPAPGEHAVQNMHILVSVGGGLVLSDIPCLLDGTPVVGFTVLASVGVPTKEGRLALTDPRGLVLAAPVPRAGWMIEALLHYTDKRGFGATIRSQRDQARTFYRNSTR